MDPQGRPSRRGPFYSSSDHRRRHTTRTSKRNGGRGAKTSSRPRRSKTRSEVCVDQASQFSRGPSTVVRTHLVVVGCDVFSPKQPAALFAFECEVCCGLSSVDNASSYVGRRNQENRSRSLTFGRVSKWAINQNGDAMRQCCVSRKIKAFLSPRNQSIRWSLHRLMRRWRGAAACLRGSIIDAFSSVRPTSATSATPNNGSIRCCLRDGAPASTRELVTWWRK